jgi:hypothetical protein
MATDNPSFIDVFWRLKHPFIGDLPEKTYADLTQ